jgi:hypothetical protein
MLLTCVQPPDNGTDFINAPTYILYVTAWKSSVSQRPSFLGQSPWATLGWFVGHPEEHNAPQWTRWTMSSVVFTHRTASFARLFREMASWELNSDRVSQLIIF